MTTLLGILSFESPRSCDIGPKRKKCGLNTVLGSPRNICLLKIIYMQFFGFQLRINLQTKQRGLIMVTEQNIKPSIRTMEKYRSTDRSRKEKAGELAPSSHLVRSSEILCQVHGIRKRILKTSVKVIKVTKRRIEHNAVTTTLWRGEGEANAE